MTTKKTTRKKITTAARKVAGQVVKAVQTAPARIRKAAKKSLASAKTAVAKQMARPAAKKSPGAARAKTAPKLKSTVIPASKPAGAPPPVVAVPRRKKLPEAYGTKQLFLIARDPRWLFAQWDFTAAEQRALNQLSADGHLTLHIFKDSPAGEPVAQVKIQAEARHWFVPVGHGETRYVAELGYHRKHGGWVSVARSKPVVTPPDTIAPDMAVMMATIPPDVPFQEVMQKFGALLAKNLPLVAAIEKIRATGWDQFPEVAVFPAAQHWTPKQARELARIAGAQSIRNRIAGELAALSSADILREIPAAVALPKPPPAPKRVLSPEALAAESAPTSPVGGWSGDLI